MLQHRAEHRIVRGQPGHTDPPPGELTRAADAGTGDHGREWALHERAHAHQVAAALAGQCEVVDVHDREVGAAGGQQLQRVRGRRGHPDLEVHAMPLVGPVPDSRVDAGVHRVRLEVEREPDVREARPLLAAAGRECKRGYKTDGG